MSAAITPCSLALHAKCASPQAEQRSPMPAPTKPKVGQLSGLGSFLSSCRGAFLGIGLMTAMINVLYLTGSFFMLEVYDRVIPSRSVPTLVGLAILALGAVRLPGRARPDPRARPGRASARRSTQALSARVFDVVVRPAAARPQPGRRPAAAARSRSGPRLPVGHGPGRVVRSAVDAALSRHLFSVPSADRRGGAGRRRSPGQPDAR